MAMNPSHEYAQILDVVSKFAIHYPGISFTCRKNQNLRASLNKVSAGKLSTAHISGTPSFESKSKIIRYVYFPQYTGSFQMCEVKDNKYKFEAEVIYTRPSNQIKHNKIIIYVNDRVVELKHTRQAVMQAFSVHLPIVAHHAHYFVYVNIKALQRDLDVNIHPTKCEIAYVYGSELSGQIFHALEKKLEVQDAKQPAGVSVFKSKEEMKSGKYAVVASEQDQINAQTVFRKSGFGVKTFAPAQQPIDTQLPPSSFVRTDSSQMKMERFFMSSHSKKKPEQEIISEREQQSEIYDELLLQKVKKFVAVGAISYSQFLVQYQNELLLLSIQPLLKELLFYRYSIQLPNENRFRLNTKIPLQQLLKETEIEWRDKCEVQQDSFDVLSSLYGIEIENSEIVAVPLILPQVVPFFQTVQYMIVQLFSRVGLLERAQNSREEICEIVSEAYSWLPRLLHKQNKGAEDILPNLNVFIESCVLAEVKEGGMKMRRKKSEEIRRSLLKITDTYELYKRFERC